MGAAAGDFGLQIRAAGGVAGPGDDCVVGGEVVAAGVGCRGVGAAVNVGEPGNVGPCTIVVTVCVNRVAAGRFVGARASQSPS